MASETILIVDADPKSQKVLEVTFQKEGYRVILTETRAEAIQRLVSETPDLVICETQLPDGDGFSFCEQFKSNPTFKHTPFIFLTEANNLANKMRGLEVGALEYLTKPIFIKDVLYRVEMLLATSGKDILDVEDGETVEGSLAEITMIDLLQTIEHEQKSGTVNLERNGFLASVYFRDGDIMDAICGKLQGEEAIYRLLLWPNGRFSIRYHDIAQRADHVPKDSSALLIEGMHRLDRWTKMVATLPNLKRIFEADYDKLPTIMREWPKEVGHIVRLFDGERTLRQIIDNSPLDDLTTLRVLRKLLDEKFIIDVTPDNVSLTQTEQHTNLAAWLSEQTQPQIAVPDEAKTTTPGQQQVPKLNLDETEDTKEEQPDDLEPGMPPGMQQDGRTWRFHWDEQQKKAVASPVTPEEEEDTDALFSIDKLEQDLETIELKRREEEARRLAAEQEAAKTFPIETPKDAKKETKETPKDDFNYVSKDDTKELHRKTILDAIEAKREAQRRDRSSTPLSMPVQVSAEKYGEDFDPMEDIADIMPPTTKKQDVEEHEPVLIPLGGPEDMDSEPEVSEYDLQALKQDSTPEETPTEEVEANQEETDHDEVDTEEASETLPPEEVETIDLPREPETTQDVEQDQSEEKEDDKDDHGPEAEDQIIADEEETEDDVDHSLDEIPVTSTSDEETTEETTEDTSDAEDELVEDNTPEEEVLPEDDQSIDAEPASLAAIAQRNPRDKELFQTSFELKKASVVPQYVEEEEDEDEVASIQPAASISSVDEDKNDEEIWEDEEDEWEDELDEDEEEEEEEDVAVAAVAATPKETKKPVEEPKPAPETPLIDDFSDLEPDKEEEFNTKGLLITIAVIAVVVFALVTIIKSNQVDPKANNPVEKTNNKTTTKTDPKTSPKVDPKVIVKVDMAKDMTAKKDMAKDMKVIGDMTVVGDMSAKDMLAKDMTAKKDMGTKDMAKADMAKKDMSKATTPNANNVGTKPKDNSGKTTKPAPKTKTYKERVKEARTLLKREKYKKAKRILLALIKEKSTGEVNYMLGRTYYDERNDAQAMTYFRRAQGQGYKSPGLYINLATLYSSAGNKRRTKEACETFLKRYPKHQYAKFMRKKLEASSK